MKACRYVKHLVQVLASIGGYAAITPLGRGAEPEEVAFLCN